MGRAEDLFARLERDGEKFIDELIATRKAEEAFLDFKRSATHGASAHLDGGDRRTLGEALSGFANSDGGVIVWGVGASQASGDVADAKHPLQDAARFASQVDNAVSGCTVPPVAGVRSVAIPHANQGSGFVATLIPQSMHGPHQVTGRGTYNIRAGSSFQPVTHGVLAGMFGRAPRPRVDLRFAVYPLSVSLLSNAGTPSLVLDLTFDAVLLNDGATLATSAFLSVHVNGMPSDSCRWNFGDPAPGFASQSSSGKDMTFVLENGRRLPPRGRAKVCMLRLATIVPDFRRPLDVQFVFGCEGSAPGELRILVAPHAFAEAFGLAQATNSPKYAGRPPDLVLEAAHLLGDPSMWERWSS